jgi:phosphatidylinositol alpha-1,6-mannosyltransferase
VILTLQTSTFGVYGGIPTYNRLVCRALNERHNGGDNLVLLGTDKPSDTAEAALELPQLRLEAFARNRLAFSRRVVELSMKRRIDLMLVGHVNYAPLALLLRRLQPEMRYGVFMYGIEVWDKLTPLRRAALRRADFTVSISKFTRDTAAHANGRTGRQTYLLPNALEMLSGDYKVVPSEWGTPEGMTLLTVCRLDPSERYKGVDLIIKALPAIASQVPGVQHIIIGSGEDSKRLQELAGSIGVADRVHFLGSVDDATLKSYYQSCDIFVMPSAKEGFGFVFLEAMQYGKPVVAAAAGGAPEVVQDEATGLLVPYGDVTHLAQAITRLCLDSALRVRLGQAGYRQLQQKFTFTQFKATLNEIITRQLSAEALYRLGRYAIA